MLIFALLPIFSACSEQEPELQPLQVELTLPAGEWQEVETHYQKHSTTPCSQAGNN